MDRVMYVTLLLNFGKQVKQGIAAVRNSNGVGAHSGDACAFQ